MMSLFSSFDLGLTYLPMFILLVYGTNLYTFTTKISLTKIILNSIKDFLKEFTESMKNKGFNKIMSSILFVMFNSFLYMNLTSILSYNFAYTTQLSILMFTSLSMWLTFMSFEVFKSTKNFLAHCVPEGTPMVLVWFLFLIELISNSIRPLTVTVRLLANIMAGHLLMTLLAALIMKMELMYPLHLVLNTIELFVALIQAYIYITMICLYYIEVK